METGLTEGAEASLARAGDASAPAGADDTSAAQASPPILQHTEPLLTQLDTSSPEEPANMNSETVDAAEGYSALPSPPQWSIEEIDGKTASLKATSSGHAAVVGARPTADILKKLRVPHAELIGKRYANEYRRSLHACSDWMEPRGVHEVTFEIRRSASKLGICLGVLGGGGKAKHSKLHGVWGLSTVAGELVHTPRLHNLDPQPQQHAPIFDTGGPVEEGTVIDMRVNFKRRSLWFRANHWAWWEAAFPQSVGTIQAEGRGLRPWVQLRPAAEM